MTYYIDNNKLIITPDTPEGMKWFTAGTSVVAGFSLMISVAGGLNYLLGHPSEELLLLTSGSFALGLILLFFSLSNDIKSKIRSIFFPSPPTVEFSEKGILFKDSAEDFTMKVILSSELESVDIGIEKEIERLNSSYMPIH